MKLLENIVESTPLLLATIFALYFYFSKGVKRGSNKSLSIFFISFALVQSFLVFSDFTDKTYGKLFLPLIVGGSLIIPPSMYFYINSLTINDKRLDIKKHFFTGGFFFVLNLILYSIIVFSSNNTALYESIRPLLTYTTLLPIAILFPLLSIYYIYASLKSINTHQTEIGDFYSYEDGINLQWVKLFLLGFILWFFVVVLDGIFNYGLEEGTTFFRKHTYDFATLVFVLFIGLKAIQQLAIDKAIKRSQNHIQKEIIEEEKAANENEVESDVFNAIWNKVEEVMNTHSPYTNIDLSIYDLAKLVDTNYKYLSKAINQYSNQNFASYINSYRVEESMHLLKNKDYDNYTIEALAEMSGFKSKSAFNTAFKKITGQTPSQFKKS